MSAGPGVNRFSWDMRYPDARGIKGGTYLMGGSLRGPTAAPGEYRVRLTVGDVSVSRTLEIRKDPRVDASLGDYQQQFEMLVEIRDALSAAHNAVNQILDLKEEISDSVVNVEDVQRRDVARREGEKLTVKLEGILNQLVELRYTGFDDQTLVWPLKLNNRIASLQSSAGVDTGPTEQCRENFRLLNAELEILLNELGQIMISDVPAFREIIRS